MGDMLAANSFDLAEVIAYRRLESKSDRALLVAISGIDAAGKGSLATRLSTNLTRLGLSVATIGIDPWQTSPALRQEADDPAEHFYLHGYRFDHLFDRVIEPLRTNRAIDLDVELLDPHADRRYRARLRHEAIDVIVLEGIFLFKRELRDRYDVSVWVECSFPTALERAIVRNQEGLPEERLVADYERIYFPAQRLHLDADRPREFADFHFPNQLQRPPGQILSSKFL
jgi:uridine kinase